MLFFPYLALYLLCGILSVAWLLPGQRVLIRLWLGSALGLFYLMWLPALAAFIWRFSMTGHLLALLPLSGLTLAAFILRDRGRALRPFGDEDKKDIRLLLFLALFAGWVRLFRSWMRGQVLSVASPQTAVEDAGWPQRWLGWFDHRLFKDLF